MYFHVSANIVVNIFTVSYLHLQFKVWFISYITINFNLHCALLLWNYIVVLERIQCSTYCQEIECLTFWEAKHTIMLETRSCCPSGKLSSKFTSSIAKFASPGLSDTTFFARCLLSNNNKNNVHPVVFHSTLQQY